jgi:hypothetical protein
MGTRKDEGDSAGDGVGHDKGARTSSRVERQGSARPKRDGRRERRDDGRRDDTRRAESFLSEVMELQQGILHAGIEAASTGIDTATRVTRNTVDRAFSRDFRDPGDVLRNLGKDADETARDVIDGLRDGPRRMHDGFYDKVRASNRTRDRGERHRRAQDDSDEG